MNINDPLCAALVFGGPNGALSIINRVPININAVRTSGMDIAASYATELWDGTLITVVHRQLYGRAHHRCRPARRSDDYAGVLGAGAPPQTSGQPKWKGSMSANYKTGPYSVTAQVRWLGSAILNNTWNTGNLATAATRWTVPDSVFNVDPTAYLDLRASYDVTENLQFYTAIDNVLDIPPQMKPGTPAASSRTAVPPTRSRLTTCWAAKSVSASASTSKGVIVPAMRTAASM